MGARRLSRWLLLAAGALALCGMPAMAQDQEPERGETVLTRRHPDFDALGVRVGSFLLFGEVNVSETLTDNVFASQDQRVSDAYTVVEPAVAARSDWNNHALEASAYGRVTRYARTTSENTDEFGARVAGRLDINRNNELSGALSYDRATESRTDPETADRDRPTQFDRVVADALYQHRINRLTLRIAGRMALWSFQEEVVRDRDRYEVRIAPRASYEVRPGLAGFVEASYERRDYPHGVEPVRNTQVYGAQIGTTFDLDGVLIGEFGAGLFTTRYRDDAFTDFVGLGLSGSAVWNITSLTTLTGEVSRRDEASDLVGASSRVRTLVGVGVQHELLRNLILTGTLRFEEEDYRGAGRTDDIYTVLAGGRYLLNRNFALFANYGYDHRVSTDPGGGFTRHQFIAGAQVRN